jgi:hypothetical protein
MIPVIIGCLLLGVATPLLVTYLIGYVSVIAEVRPARSNTLDGILHHVESLRFKWDQDITHFSKNPANNGVFHRLLKLGKTHAFVRRINDTTKLCLNLKWKLILKVLYLMPEEGRVDLAEMVTDNQHSYDAMIELLVNPYRGITYDAFWRMCTRLRGLEFTVLMLVLLEMAKEIFPEKSPKERCTIIPFHIPGTD